MQSRDPIDDDTEGAHDEERLVVRAQAGDAEARDRLLGRHYATLLAVLRSAGASGIVPLESSSDLAQSTCRLAIEKLDGFRYQGEGSFRAWLLKLAEHRVVDKRRFHHAQKRDVDRNDYELLSQLYASVLSPSRVLSQKEMIDAFEEAFARLPEAERDLIRMHDFEGLEHAAIAERLGKTTAAVRQAFRRAKVRLAAYAVALRDDGAS